MRICFVAPYPPERDGIGDQTAGLVASLSRAGHETMVVAARAAEPVPTEVRAGLPRSAGELDRLLRELDSWRPDVIHVQFGVAAFGTRTPALLRMLGRLQSAPGHLVISLHELTRDTGLLRAPGRALYRRIAGRAELVIVHTRAAAVALQGLVADSPVRARVIPLPARTPPPASVGARELRARHGLANRRVLLAFGFIHVDKGLTDLVRAFGELVHGGGPAAGDTHLAVVGAVRRRHGAFRLFELRDRLHLARARRLVRRGRLGDRVTFAGYAPEGEIRPWFELSECAVMPYRRIDQSAVAQFASALGTPMLTSDLPALAELETDERLRFPPRRPDLLAATLRRFLSDGPPPRAPRPVEDDGLDDLRDALLDCYAALRSSPASRREVRAVG